MLHIPPNEARVFETKERAPYMICIEIYRPEEISIASTSSSHSEASFDIKVEAPRRKISEGLMTEPNDPD